MQKIIQIYTCLLKLSRKQESVMDGQTDGQTDGRYYYIPSPLLRGDNNIEVWLITWLEDGNEGSNKMIHAEYLLKLMVTRKLLFHCDANRFDKSQQKF